MERKVSEKRRPTGTDAGSLSAAWESILEARLAERQAGAPGRPPDAGEGAQADDDRVGLSRLGDADGSLSLSPVRDAAAQLMDMQMRVDAAESARAEAVKRTEVLESEVARLRSAAEVSDEMRRNAESETAWLKTRAIPAETPAKALVALREERDVLEHDLAEARSKVEGLTRERDEARTKAVELETELASLRSAALGADRARDDAEGRFRELAAQLDAARASESEARGDLAAADSRCADLEIELEKLRAARGRQREDGAESLGQDEIDKVVGEFSRGGPAVSVAGAREEALKAELDEARARFAVAESVRSAAEERLARAEAKASELARSASEMAARLRASEEARRRAERELQARAESDSGAGGVENAELRRRLDEAYGIIRAIEDAYLRGQSRRLRLPRGPR
jgi:uncharacterized protein (DUF4415 family)